MNRRDTSPSGGTLSTQVPPGGLNVFTLRAVNFGPGFHQTGHGAGSAGCGRCVDDGSAGRIRQADGRRSGRRQQRVRVVGGGRFGRVGRGGGASAAENQVAGTRIQSGTSNDSGGRDSGIRRRHVRAVDETDQIRAVQVAPLSAGSGNNRRRVDVTQRTVAVDRWRCGRRFLSDHLLRLVLHDFGVQRTVQWTQRVRQSSVI
jgi:hypothetical protein